MLARNGFILDQRKYTNDPIHQDYIQILAGMNTDDSIQVIAGDITRTQNAKKYVYYLKNEQ